MCVFEVYRTEAQSTRSDIMSNLNVVQSFVYIAC